MQDIEVIIEETAPDQGAIIEIEDQQDKEAPLRDVPLKAPWNTVEEAFLKRRSVRKYRKKQVPEHLIRRMLEVGRFAPSQGNCQPWKFLVVRDRAMIDEMEAHCVSACKKMMGVIDYTVHEKGTFARLWKRALARFFARRDPNTVHPVPVGAAKEISEGRFAVFHGAPTIIFLLMDTRGVGHPEIDIGICGTHISVTAHSLGLGACWVGFSSMLDTAKWRKRLGVAHPYKMIEAIVVGYPLGNPTRNFVSRETHEISWFENGIRHTVY